MKIGQPYRCDGPGCKKLREDDTNHWWIVGLVRDVEYHPEGAYFFVSILPWDRTRADGPVSHACGIDCGTKIAASLMAQIVERSTHA